MGVGDFSEFQLLTDAIESHGSNVIVCDVTKWPGDTRISYTPEEEGATLDSWINYDEITGAYILSSKLFKPNNLRFNDSLDESLRPTLNQLGEYRAIFESICYILERHKTNVIPLFENHRWHDRKPWQLTLCADERLPIPSTIFTNSPEEVIEFSQNHEKIIYKPVTRGGSPKLLTDEDLTESRLSDLATAPVQFQEYIPGDDIRIYFLNQKVIGGIRYLSDNFSFKIDMMQGESVDVEPAEPSPEMETAVRRAAETAGLVFGAVDIRKKSSGEFKILEINDIPRFAAADMYCEQNIAEQLAEFLTD